MELASVRFAALWLSAQRLLSGDAMLAPLMVAVLVASEAPEGDAQAELDACAQRIEELKARRQAGEESERQLERLLIRAQELAAELERAANELPPAAAGRPGPEELRERADAARDEADRLTSEIAGLDVRLHDARRIAHAELGGAVERAAVGARMPGAALERVRALEAERNGLAARRARAEAEAAQLDAEAREADADR